MRKLLLILLCIGLLLSHATAATNQITQLDAQVRVDDNGVCRIMVFAEVLFIDRPTAFLFPLGTDAEDISPSGSFYEIETIDGVKCVSFLDNLGFQGSQSFQCTYTLPYSLTESSNGQHFTLLLPERGWEYPIEHFKLTVNFPTDISAFPQWSSAYYGDVIDNYLHIQITENLVTAESNIVFRDHESLTMELDFPSETFVIKNKAQTTVSFDRLIFILLLVLCIGYWILFCRKNLVFPKKDSSFTFQCSAGEVPCQLFGDKVDIGALIAHWGSLGYILLHRTKAGGFRLEKQMNMGNERNRAERRIFHEIFRSTSFIEVPGQRFLNAYKEQAPVLRIHWKHRMFQKHKGSPSLLRHLCLLTGLFLSLMTLDTLFASTPMRWIGVGFLTILTLPLYMLLQQIGLRFYRSDRRLHMILGLLSAVILYFPSSAAGCVGYYFFNTLLQIAVGFLTCFGSRRTVPGQEAAQELLGFRRFLSRCEPSTAKTIVQRDSQYFYRILPYAEVLGMGDRFVKQFGSLTTESCHWFVDDAHRSYSPKDFYKLYLSLLKKLRHENRFNLLSLITKIGKTPVSHGSPAKKSVYAAKAGQPSLRHSKPQVLPSEKNGKPPRRTQHRANPARTGRRR